MGNSLEAYRAAIGLFHAHTRKSNRPINFSAYSYKDIFLIDLPCSFLFAALLCLQSLNPNVNAVFLLFILTFILMVGNVETNPGPQGPSSSSSQNIILDKAISLCNLNIRSLRNKIDFLNDFAEDLDILLLTETHLDERIDECDIFLESFSNIIQRKDRTNAGDGLLIYAKDSIRMVRKQELENSIDATLWVEINAKCQSFLVCNTYRAQWTDPDYWNRLMYAIELAT